MEPIASSGASQVFRPAGGASSGELAALLRDGRILAAEVLSHPADGTVMLAVGRQVIPAESELVLDPGTRFLVRVEEDASGVVLRLVDGPADEDAVLLRALRSVLGSERPLGELLGDLARALREESARSELPPALQALARGLGAQVARLDGGANGLRALLLSAGLGHEAALAAFAGARAPRDVLERLRGDLKALLLRAGAALEGSGRYAALREAVTRTLTGLEAEQLLNLARERAGEPALLSFPIADGDGLATARLRVPPRGERESGEAPGEDAPFRLSLGLELTHLGPLRADLALARTTLSVRISVARPAVARRIQADLAALDARLGDGARAVRVQVRVAPAAEVALGFDPLDSRFLREHHVMNVAG